MCKYIITKDEIKEAERDIFENDSNFNDEQTAFIKCLDPCCVQAYAGTGKTRALAGKLHVLAQKEVWKDCRGICIISHTNVAVDEIKKHVAKHYPAVMEYPNFVGTIQEFVNKFLFIPYLASKGLKIRFQEDNRFFNFDSHQGLKDRIQKHRNSINRAGNVNKEWQMGNFNEALYSCFIHKEEVCYRNVDGVILNVADLPKFATKSFTKQNIRDGLSALIKDKHSLGSFLYEESFVYGYEYLIIHSVLKNTISNRFRFVFLDEAQDCSELQLKILNELFGEESNTVFQQIGDENQSISEQYWKPAGNILHFGNSMRFGGGIENSINRLRIDGGSGINEDDRVKTKKYLLKYDACPENVLDKFLEVLESETIPFDEDKGYFAISHRHRNLSDAFPYSEEIARRKNKKIFYKFENDNVYLSLITKEAIQKFGSNFVSKILLNLFYKYFKADGTWSDLREMLRSNEFSNSFKSLVIKLSNDVLENGKITNVDSIKTFSNSILGDEYLNNLDVEMGNVGGVSEAQSILDNLYPPPPSEDKPKIKMGTIHSVKGQTHNATLLLSAKLESKQDIEHALGRSAVLTPKYKRNLYVAFSRAQDLFAFAIDKTVYDGLSDKSIFNDFTEKEI